MIMSYHPPPTVTSPAPAAAWQEVLDRAAAPLPSQTPAWLRCVCAVDGYEDASRLYEIPDGRRLVLPLVRRGPAAFAREAALPIGWGPGGLVGDGGVCPEDIAMIVGDIAGRRPLSIQLRPDPAQAAVWESGMPPGVRRERRMSQVLFLEGDFDQIWRTRFHKGTRYRVRLAERRGVVVRRDDSGALVPAFHDLYVQSVDRWARREGVPLPLARWRAARREPPRKLRTVATAEGTGCRLYGAFLDDRPIAAIVVLFGRGTAVYWRGAMAAETAGPVYANYLLQRTAIADAVAAGCGSYQMGDSAPGSPLAEFKCRFGAVEQHYASYRMERVPISVLTGRARAAARRILQRRAPG
jgi:hypothetical protein